MAKTKKVKKVSVSKAKQKAWAAFSEYIRRKYSNSNGIVKCVTCSWQGHWTEAQAGHFVDGRNNRVLYNESLVHPQCVTCNVFKHGNKIAYAHFMSNTYNLNIDDLKHMDDMKFEVVKMSASDHIQVYELYKQLIKEFERR